MQNEHFKNNTLQELNKSVDLLIEENVQGFEEPVREILELLYRRIDEIMEYYPRIKNTVDKWQERSCKDGSNWNYDKKKEEEKEEEIFLLWQKLDENSKEEIIKIGKHLMYCINIGIDIKTGIEIEIKPNDYVFLQLFVQYAEKTNSLSKEECIKKQREYDYKSTQRKPAENKLLFNKILHEWIFAKNIQDNNNYKEQIFKLLQDNPTLSEQMLVNLNTTSKNLKSKCDASITIKATFKNERRGFSLDELIERYKKVIDLTLPFLREYQHLTQIELPKINAFNLNGEVPQNIFSPKTQTTIPSQGQGPNNTQMGR